MSIKIMCKPRNAAERKLLIDVGIITSAQRHPWVFLEQLFARGIKRDISNIHSFRHTFCR